MKHRPTHGRTEKTYVAAAFPSACGKTNFAMLIPPAGFEGWKVWTVGDDIAWIKPDATGQLRAINPEAGFFGVAPGTPMKTNPNAMATLTRNTIFTNVAAQRQPDGGVWWEGMTDAPPAEHSSTGAATPGHPPSARNRPPAAHPNGRFTAPPASAPPSTPTGRTPTASPSPPSSSAAAAPPPSPSSTRHSTGPAASTPAPPWARKPRPLPAARVGKVRRDPMAMLPFCGYHMGDYFRHWIRMQRTLSVTPAHLPRQLVPQR